MTQINQHCLVLMVGPSGSGKSTLASKHFNQSEIVSSDSIRAELLGDFRIQSNNYEIWQEVHRRVEQRLSWGRRVVVDATNIKTGDRKPFIDMAKKWGVELVYLVVNRTVESKLKTGGWRLEVNGLIERHEETFMNNYKSIMKGDGVAKVIKLFADTQLKVINYPLDSNDKLVNRTINLVPKEVDKPVVVVGDIHGNINSLDEVVNANPEAHFMFLGDVIDYGHFNLLTFDTVYELMRTGRAHMVQGNHEKKLDRWINADFGRSFKGVIGNGLAMTVSELTDSINASPLFKDRFIAKWRFMINSTRQHYVVGDYMFTHGAASLEMWNMFNKHTLHGDHQNLAFFGQVDKNLPTRQDGVPNRIYDWVEDVPKNKIVVVGHDPRSKIEPFIVVNKLGGKVIFLDTGSSKGGCLSTLTIGSFKMA